MPDIDRPHIARDWLIVILSALVVAGTTIDCHNRRPRAPLTPSAPTVYLPVSFDGRLR